ncbi:MAG: dGTP triphosphohydrolase [Candidatus Edwardsbacteria bacterium]
MHKTQVLTTTKGDHFRTRLTHTLEVSQIARSIAKLLGLNEELVEAIALGHDLGHTPFGHVSERVLNRIISGKTDISGKNFGGFKHNFQSVRIADHLEQWALDNVGFNLTLVVRDGILKHSTLKSKKTDPEPVRYPDLKLISLETDIPFSIEGQVVKISDDIAQITHDLEDGFRLGIIKINDFSSCQLVETVCENFSIPSQRLTQFDTRQLRSHLIGPMVGFLIHDAAQATLAKIQEKFKTGPYPYSFEEMYVTFSMGTENAAMELKNIINDLFVTSLQVSTMDSRAEYLVTQLFKAYWRTPAQLPDLILSKYFHRLGMTFSRRSLNQYKRKMHNDPYFARAICDHIACMTDNYAFTEYKKLYLPE